MCLFSLIESTKVDLFQVNSAVFCSSTSFFPHYSLRNACSCLSTYCFLVEVFNSLNQENYIFLLWNSAHLSFISSLSQEVPFLISATLVIFPL